eukprot:COSAG06_NODE_478_length_15216_cov_101.587286_16_plen_106_part_00
MRESEKRTGVFQPTERFLTGGFGPCVPEVSGHRVFVLELGEVGLQPCVQKRHSFLSAFLCLSRASFGKRMIFSIKWHRKEMRFLTGLKRLGPDPVVDLRDEGVNR